MKLVVFCPRHFWFLQVEDDDWFCMQIKFGSNHFSLPFSITFLQQNKYFFSSSYSPVLQSGVTQKSFKFAEIGQEFFKKSKKCVFRISHNKYDNESVQLYFYLEDSQMYKSCAIFPGMLTFFNMVINSTGNTVLSYHSRLILCCNTG